MIGTSLRLRAAFALAAVLAFALAIAGPARAQGTEQVPKVKAQTEVPIPLPDTAEDIEFDGVDGKLEFTSDTPVRALATFYRATLKPLGWKEQGSVINRANMAVLELSKDDKSLTITIMQMGGQSNVNALGDGLMTTAAKAAQEQQANATPPSKEDLEVEESGGLPVPRRHTLSAGTQTPFRRELSANLPIGLPFVLEFYRRELASRRWTEDTSKAAIQPDQAMLVFASAEGPAVLTLGRKNGETTVLLVVRMTDEATKAGVLPKAGQSRLIMGNMTKSAATVTINKQTINIGAGVGEKAPNGPSLDLAPGKYSYSVKVGGRTQSDQLEVSADQTWGLMIGPGGGLALQIY
jgi:hypothetical protein